MAELKGKIEVEVKEMSSVKGMTTCKICGRDFPLIIEEHYVARDLEKKGVLPALSGEVESAEFDAFECPHCGCQNIMQSRKPTLFSKGECPCDFGICDECDHVGESKDTKEHDGCSGCAHEDVPMGEYPCNECKGSYFDMWEKKEDNDE